MSKEDFKEEMAKAISEEMEKQRRTKMLEEEIKERITEEEICERCKGTGRVGTAISTEGSIDIICLECLGTGKKLKKQNKRR